MFNFSIYTEIQLHIQHTSRGNCQVADGFANFLAKLQQRASLFPLVSIKNGVAQAWSSARWVTSAHVPRRPWRREVPLGGRLHHERPAPYREGLPVVPL